MENEKLRELEGKVKSGKVKLSVSDGKYLLPDPDRRIVVKQGDKYTLIGHRSKKLHRILKKRKPEHLRALLKRECYRRNVPEGVEIELLNIEELARLMNPRPEQYFHRMWLESSESKEAQYLRETLPKAERLA